MRKAQVVQLPHVRKLRCALTYDFYPLRKLRCALEKENFACALSRCELKNIKQLVLDCVANSKNKMGCASNCKKLRYLQSALRIKKQISQVLVRNNLESNIYLSIEQQLVFVF